MAYRDTLGNVLYLIVLIDLLIFFYTRHPVEALSTWWPRFLAEHYDLRVEGPGPLHNEVHLAYQHKILPRGLLACVLETLGRHVPRPMH